MNITLCGSDSQRSHIEWLRVFFYKLKRCGAQVAVERSFRDYLEDAGVPMGSCEPVDNLPADCDLLLSMGGDGTFLRTAAWMRGSRVPVMGINTGHLGYLAAYSLHDMEDIMRGVRGEYELSPRIMLELGGDDLPADFHPNALNEIAVSKGDTTSMVRIQVYVNGHFLADYLADGLIISTPTGSTAYNLSCGGPIIEPTQACVVLSPIAPHSLTLRPLVISADSVLRLEVSSRGAEECHVGVDGRTFSVDASGSTLRIGKSRDIVNVAQPVGSFFAGVLRHKLRWGEGPLRD